MAVSFPMYLILIDSNGKISLDDVKAVGDAWQSAHNVSEGPIYGSGTTSTGGTDISIDLPSSTPQELVQLLTDELQDTFPNIPIHFELSEVEQLEEGDMEKMMQGQPYSVRKRGPLN